MERTTISRLYADSALYDGKTITVCGWARTIRDLKNFAFISLNDGSCFSPLQVVVEKEQLSNYDEVVRQNVGAAFVIEGTFVLTPNAKQPFELKAADVYVEGSSAPDYPLQKKRHSVEFLRTIAHLRPRTNLLRALSTSTPPSSPPLTARAPGRCSGSPRWIWRTFPNWRTAPWITARTSSASPPT